MLGVLPRTWSDPSGWDMSPQMSSPHKNSGSSTLNKYEVPPSGCEAHWEVVERILFIYAKLNPGIAYVQGMNEIVGPLYYTFATDPNSEWKGKRLTATCSLSGTSRPGAAQAGLCPMGRLPTPGPHALSDNRSAWVSCGVRFGADHLERWLC